ncbi:MAG: glycine--tRNA ligase subunit beta [Candidatus Sphingomonas phytovorans]|nr:glycine--tRNA ligase subunit beta [Sphingomonas sp.]WEK01703.1 MAG: glycine--tRNA ligase subunit beta [Sphingomonas sp.]
MTDFLLELRSEEIPARMQDKARDDLARLFAAELDKAGLRADAIVTFATPRRLALIARDLPVQTEATAEERKGPRADAPAQALEGFLRSTGLTRDQLEERDDGKGNKVLFAVTQKPGRATADVLAETIPTIVRAFPWPKSMRWGDASISTESLRWVRPLQGIVALLGEDVVPFEIAGIASGAATVGHRFHHPGAITIGSASDYAEKLRACHVLIDQDERRAIIRERASALAAEAGLDLIEDEGLVAENAGLTEWPVPLLGRFDPEFLSVPPEVIQLTARVNQKYFVCRDGAGKLANAFICTANIDAVDGGAKIVEGNRKVIAARLSDAKFFYETDLKMPLDEQAVKLGKIVFHEKLGTVADKVERVAKLARWLVEEGIVTSSPSPLVGEGRGPSQSDGKGEGGTRSGLEPHPPHPSVASLLPPSPTGGEGISLADMAERAARLAKADLVTGMVGEFPELQGLMGGYYARAQGEDPQVADAIRDHYKPVGQGDDVPTAPITVAVSLADKLDTIGSFFAVNEKPTGSKDPFALRRAALAVIALAIENDLRFTLKAPLWATAQMQRFQRGAAEGVAASLALLDVFSLMYEGDQRLTREATAAALKARLAAPDKQDDPIDLDDAVNFFADRLKVQQREAGIRHDLIDAVFALGGEDDLVRLLARVHALQWFVITEDGTNLLAGYKRAANILKKEGFTAAEDKKLSYEPEPAESALVAALDFAEPRARDAVGAEDFEGAMAALASLRGPIDRFFDDVTVNDPDPAKRDARLALLARVRNAVHSVADFSKIEG